MPSLDKKAYQDRERLSPSLWKDRQCCALASQILALLGRWFRSAPLDSCAAHAASSSREYGERVL